MLEMTLTKDTKNNMMAFIDPTWLHYIAVPKLKQQSHCDLNLPILQTAYY